MVELPKRGAKRLGLRPLIRQLLVERIAHLAARLGALQCGAREAVVLPVHRELRLPHPFGMARRVLLLLLDEQVFVGNRDGHLCLHLNESLIRSFAHSKQKA